MDSSIFYGAVLKSRKPVVTQEARMNAMVKALLYLLSAFVPAAGWIVGAALYLNSERGYKRVGKACIEISTAVMFVATLFLAIASVAILA